MNNRRRFLVYAFILSVLFHMVLLIWINWNRWWDMILAQAAEEIPEEMVITFPENRPEEPREVVENINENEEVPEETNLLSERNSRARNPERSDQTGDKPRSEGSSPFSNLSRPSGEQRTFRAPGARKFSSDALTGKQVDELERTNQQDRQQQSEAQAEAGTGQMLEQKDFSVEELGSLSLSTYQWPYAPYINALREKLYRVWNVPPAFYMGLISGQSIVMFEISREGNLKQIKLIDHRGHESLEIASMESIKALFPFLPLPESFPDETLIITAKLHYPNLKNRR
jgi:outer membrane biosynthesis protein TonB